MTQILSSYELVGQIVRQTFGVAPDVMAALAHGDEEVRLRPLPETARTTDPNDGIEVFVRRVVAKAVAIDTQSVKCIPVRGPRGYDAAKKVVGRKRVLLVDADGAVLAVAVVPADMQDRDCLEALSAGKAAWPSLRVSVLDGAFTAERCRDWCHQHGMRHRVVAREPGQRGFVVLERRWVVERSLGAFTHWGGLLRGRAGRLDVSAAESPVLPSWPPSRPSTIPSP